MLSLCPQCNQKLEDFAVSCEDCGWSIVSEHVSSAKPNSNSHVSTSRIETDSASRKRSQASLDTMFQVAMKSLDDGDFASALNELNRSIDAAPVNRLGECYSLRGYCHLKKNDFKRAEDDCSEAISLNCQDAQTYAWRAAARGEQNKWKEAFDDLDSACVVAGDDRDAFVELTDSYADTATEYFRKQIDAGNQSADLFFERGWLYLRTGKADKARQDFTAALEIDPLHAWASTGKAKLLLKDNRLLSRLRRASRRRRLQRDCGKLDELSNEAIILCNLGSAKNAPNACQREAMTIRAKLYQHMGKPDRANLDLRRLTKRAAGDPEKIVECCQLRFELADYMAAVTQLTALLKENPTYQRALLLRGKCYAKVRNYPLAIDDLEAYLRLNSADSFARAELAQVFLVTHQIDRASVEFEKVTRDNQTSFEAYLGLCKIFLAKERLDLAISQCEKAIAIDSQRPEAFAVRAEIYLKLGDFARSVDAYSRAAKIASDSEAKASYLYLRGAVYYEMAKFDLAAKDFSRSSRLRPNHAGAWVWKAATCSRLERWSDANESLSQAMAIRPEAASQYRRLGQRIAQKAVKHFSNQIQHGKDSRRVYRDRAAANQFLQKYALAIEDLTTALEREPDDADLLVRRGQVFAVTGDHQGAQEDFGKAIKLDRRNHWARFCRAQSRYACGDHEKARRDVQKAIRICGGYPQYHKLLAEILADLGQSDQVVGCLNRATLLDSTDAASFRARGDAQVALKNWLDAVNDYTRAMELDPTQVDLLLSRATAYARADKPKSAIMDYELALTRNPLLAKAWSGRAGSLATIGQHEYALIWLTKAFHRFSKPRDLSELLFARGKIFYGAGRFLQAIIDFSSVARLMKHDDKFVGAAKYARGIARVQVGQLELAYKDFKTVFKLDPRNVPAQVAIKWLKNPQSALPLFLEKPEPKKKPIRPPVVRSPVVMTTSEKDWRVEKPFDCWILRTLDKMEYGPVKRDIINHWIEEGRIDFGMRLLRADWPKWKKVERIFKELRPIGSSSEEINADEYPELEKPPLSPS